MKFKLITADKIGRQGMGWSAFPQRAVGLTMCAIVMTLAGCAKKPNGPVTPPPSLSIEDPDPNIRLVRAAAAGRVDLVKRALAEGASPNFVAEKSIIFPPGRIVVPRDHFAAVCIEDAAQVNPGAITEILVEAGADPNACGRGLIGPHDDYYGFVTPHLATILVQHGYMPSHREVEDADRVLTTAPGLTVNPPAFQSRIDLADIVLSGNGPAVQAYKRRKLEAQFQAQMALQTARAAFDGIPRGTTVCSKPGKLQQKYVAYLEDREGDRIQLRIAGSMSGIMTEYRTQDVVWESILLWAPCDVSRR